MKTKFYLSVVVLMVFGMISFTHAQNDMRVLIKGDKGTTAHSVRLSPAQQIPFAPAQAKTVFGLDSKSDLVLKKSEEDKLGQVHYRFNQSYKGIPVEHATYIVHTKDGKLIGMNGAIILDFNSMAQQSATPAIRQADAVQAALRVVNASAYAWQSPDMENALKATSKNTAATYYPTPALVWYSTSDQIDASQIHLAYKVDVYAKQPLSRAFYFIDAQTGRVLGNEDELNYSDASGTANTVYSGTRTIHSDLNSGTYTLHDASRGGGINSMRPDGSDFTSGSANWSLSQPDQYALDAHWGVSTTYDFYNTIFGRNSVDNGGYTLNSYINDTTIHNNAYWDGSSMHYGVRFFNPPSYYPAVTAIDVTAHELTHGVTQNTCGLIYQKEPGGMNESMSDIFGKSVQFWAKPSDINWQLSNDMGWIIRDMSNPKNNGQPDTYLGTNWYVTVGCTPTGGSGGNDDCGVHTNSGVGNYMFYLLVAGGSGTNDNGTGYCVSGLGLTEADAILYRTETVKLTSTSQYVDWFTACIDAATDLYGANSNEVQQVANAWSAVGVSGINTGSIANVPYCTPASVSVPYTLNNTITYNAGNVFTAQLSDASGSFASPVNIGTRTATSAGTINATIPGGTAQGTGYRIRVVSSNPASIGSENCADLTVDKPVTVTQNPSSQFIQWGDPFSFTSAATGEPAPTVQWQVSTNGGGTWNDIGAATSTTLNISCVSEAMNNNQYRAAFTNPCGTVNSNPATLTVSAAITLQPTDVNAQWGDNVSFTSTAAGTVAPAVQWMLSTDGGATYNDIPTATSTTLNLTCVTLAMDGYKYKARFTNTCDVAYSNPATLTVRKKTVTANIVVAPNPRQYSDTVSITITIPNGFTCGEQAATGADIYIGTQYMGHVTFSTSGTDLVAGLYDVLLLEPSPFGTSPVGNMSPGNHAVTAVLTGVSNDYQITNNGTILHITQEDARAYYTGALYVGTTTATSQNAVITLAATFKDITAVLGDVAYDQWAGDIRNATITFINRDNNTIIASNVPFGLVSPSDSKVAVATYNWNVTITGNSQTYTVGIIIGNYYIDNNNAEDVVITVAQPMANTVTGGGYLILTSPGGLKSGDIGSKENFGFNAKYNNGGGHLQGNMNTIVRKTESSVLHTYQIKCSQLSSISVHTSPAGGTATINGRAMIRDITDPNNAIMVDNNASLQMNITDNGNPGSSDLLAITIWNRSGGLWFASNWNGTTTVQQVISAGNEVVHSNSSFRMETEEEPSIVSSEVTTVYPNPASDYINLNFNSPSADKYSVSIIDLTGRTVLGDIVNATEGNNLHEINLSNVAKGMYILLLENANTKEQKRIIVQ